jgi:hypothetical protein
MSEKEQPKMSIVGLTAPEHNMILAALRHWQETNGNKELHHFEEIPALSDEQVDDLCLWINTDGVVDDHKISEEAVKQVTAKVDAMTSAENFTYAQIGRLLVDATRVEMRLRALVNPDTVAALMAQAKTPNEKRVIAAKVEAITKHADDLGNALDGLPPEVKDVFNHIGVIGETFIKKGMWAKLQNQGFPAWTVAAFDKSISLIESRYRAAIEAVDLSLPEVQGDKKGVQQ